jgi:hypothetical protein
MRILLIIFSIVLLGTKSFSQKNSPSESIYLHVDKDTYLPGEILWFKVYTVSGDKLAPVNLSSVAYVDIVNSAGVIVFQTKAELGAKLSNSGSVYIPLSLNTGSYKLVAYTKLSKGNSQTFSKDLRILNPFAINEPPIVALKANLIVDFFPEGGVLVNGLQSKVGFKITDAYGKGVKSDVTILKNGSTPVGTYSSNDLGIGSFVLSPNEGETYKAKIAKNGTEVLKDLPNPQNEGFVLAAEDSENVYKIKISGSAKLISSKLVLKYGFNEERTQEIVLAGSRKAEATIQKTDLPAGTSRLTLFDVQNRPVAERILFRSPENTSKIDFKLNKATFSARDQVEISIADFQKNIIAPSLSVSVIKIDDIQRTPDENILSYLYLSKDLKGKVENPKHYFSNGTKKEDIDNLLLTQGWRKFAKVDTLPDSRYHSIKIRYTSKSDGSAIANQEVLLSTPERDPMIYSAVTNTEGVATFWIKNIYGTRQLATRLSSGLHSHIEILSSASAYSKSAFSPLELSKISQESYDAYGVNVQVQNAYSGKERAQFLPPASLDSIAFYGKPDYRYSLDDYTRFVLMEEVLREYIKPVNVRKSRDNYSLRVLDEVRGVYFNTDPLILLDGVPVTNTNDVLHYDPLKVKNIEVIAGKYFFGESTYDGIVSFSTYKGNLQDFTLDPSYSIFSYEGLQLEREYYSPALTKDSRTPDNRTVLYWNPNVSTSKEGKIQFNTSDITGKYLIDFQGIDRNGTVLTGQTEFIVSE